MNVKILSVGRQEDTEPIDALVLDVYNLTTRSATEFCNKRNSQLSQITMITSSSVYVDKPIDNVKLSDLPEYRMVIQTFLLRDEPSYAIDGRVVFRVDMHTRCSISRGSTMYVWINDSINVIGIDAHTFADCIKYELKKSSLCKNIEVNATNVNTAGEITTNDMSGYYHS